MGSYARAASVLGVACGAMLACGGLAADDTTGDASSDHTLDAKHLDSGLGLGDGAADGASSEAGVAPCPLSPPKVGDPCAAPQQCEYGPSFHPECDTMVQCTSGGTWALEWDGVTSCTFTDQGCPAVLADIDSPSCPSQGMSCNFGDTQCDCVGGCGGGAQLHGGAPLGQWSCVTKDGTGTCPWPRPRIGTACGPTDFGCAYAAACCPGWNMACTSGVWQGVTAGPCP
ncbi:MAG TPA: hypothetical protein VLM85_33585 [Polyangiaceae bacterium]|nr:hypothetical protein [Polyangiaceae bacterium]